MGSATAHLVGNVGTEPRKVLDNPGHERLSFRLIATERRRDPATGAWADGDECAVTVVCWGALARSAAQSIRIGDPVTVSGKLATRSYEVDGIPRLSVEVKATALGHDLSRGQSTFQRSRQAGDAPDPQDRDDQHAVNEAPQPG